MIYRGNFYSNEANIKVATPKSKELAPVCSTKHMFVNYCNKDLSHTGESKASYCTTKSFDVWFHKESS